MAKFDMKMLGMVLVGGSITSVVGSFVLPYANQFLSFIPQIKLLVDGLTPHVALSYGLGFTLGMMAVKKLDSFFSK